MITLSLKLEVPPMPTKLRVIGIQQESLDEAIAAGTSNFMIGVAQMDEEAVEAYLGEYAEKFREHVKSLQMLCRIGK